MTLASGVQAAAIEAATAAGVFGLYPATSFRLVTRRVHGLPDAAPGAVVFPRRDHRGAESGTAGGVVHARRPAFDDVRAWASTRAADAAIDYPPLVWVESPQVARGARMTADGTRLEVGDTSVALKPEPKIPLNRSYYDAASIAYFQDKALTVRGSLDGSALTMRTVWPEDFGLGGAAPPVRALPDAGSPALALRALMREAPRGGAQSPFVAHTLWQRDAARPIGTASRSWRSWSTARKATTTRRTAVTSPW